MIWASAFIVGFHDMVPSCSCVGACNASNSYGLSRGGRRCASLARGHEPYHEKGASKANNSCPQHELLQFSRLCLRCLIF